MGSELEHSAEAVAAHTAAAAAPAPAALALAPAAAALVGTPGARAAGVLRQAAALKLQRSHGNTALTGWLARKDKPKAKRPRDRLTWGLGSAGIVDDQLAETALYPAPDETETPIGTLKQGQEATLIGEAGGFYIVMVDGVRGYVKQSGIATVVHTPGAAQKGEWDKRLRQALKDLDDAGHAGGAAVTSGGGQANVSSGPHEAFSGDFMALQYRLSSLATWDQVTESAQALLRDYALWYFKSHHATEMPANLRVFFEYIGRGTKNEAAAAKGGFKSTRRMGGYMEGGKASKDWCTWATSRAVMDALAESKSGVSFEKLKKSTIGAPEAHAAPLMPGDQVMYLFKGCQFGGHSVTVIDDIGDSFTHVSGNATNAGVMIGEKKRMLVKPSGLDLARACPPPVYKEDKKTIDKAATDKVHAAANEYLRTVDHLFGDQALIYSIVRYGEALLSVQAGQPKPSAGTASAKSP